MPPIKVLQVGPLPPPVGGMASVVENLAGVLADSCQVRVLNNVKTTPLDRSLFQGIRAQLRLVGSLARLCLGWRPDVVHIHTCSCFSFWRSAADVMLARLLGRRIVLHIHGAQFRKFLDSLSPVSVRLARGVFGLCTRIVVLGEAWKQLLDRWGDPARVAVVPNGVPVPASPTMAGGAEFTIVCLANYERRKGQADLLEAAAALQRDRPLRIALLGFEAEAGERQALLERAAALGLADRVEIPGPVVGELKEDWWARARCFCLPSYDEGLPMSMLEAMARGIPVVATRVGAIPEAVEDGREGLLCDAGDVPGLAACLRRLLDDPPMAQAVGRAGRDRVVREFSLERSAALLLEIYRELLR